MNTIRFSTAGLSLRFFVPKDAPVSFFITRSAMRSSRRCEEDTARKWARLVEVQARGFDQDDHHGNKYTGTSPADRLRYVSHRLIGTSRRARRLEVVQETPEGLRATSVFEFSSSQPAFTTWVELTNHGSEPFDLEYVASLCVAGISRGGAGRWSERTVLHLADNNWCGECRWRSGPPGAFGLDQFYAEEKAAFGISRIAVSSQGTWSTAGSLPLGVLENTSLGHTHVWEIVHNGSWLFEISDIAGELYLKASGPTFREGHWLKRLTPGSSFQSVPVRYGCVEGGLQEALRCLTRVRRAARTARSHADGLPVVFNDYMNCLMGDPTEEKLRPLIERAARVGCEYFVIDAGWYASRGRSWWDTVGAWKPDESRFPSGLRAVTDLIRKKGMIPGLWLEIEVVGIRSAAATEMPDAWFFMRGGRRVIDHGRHQLDFRNPAVREHADAVLDRLVRAFGLGYIKMDYNINAGPGTDLQADSCGDGLLEHNRAYLAWIARVTERHPGLIVENCASGGMRMDAAMLRQHSVQSVTDQTDARFNAVIAASCASAVPPEQAGIWSYPTEDDDEHVIFNMVNSLLCRVCLSGRLTALAPSRLARVAEAIAFQKQHRDWISSALPFWPLGLPKPSDPWVAFGLAESGRQLLAVWRLDGRASSCEIPLSLAESRRIKIEAVYPADKKTRFRFDPRSGVLHLRLPRPRTARVFQISPC